MKIQQKKERELAQREGSAKTTLIQGTWLLISFIIAYFLFSYLDSSGTLTVRAIRSALFIPGSIPDWGILAGAMLIFVIISQIALALGFFLASPSGRRKAGHGDLYSRHNDMNDNF